MINSPLVTMLGLTFNIYGVVLLVLAVVFLLALYSAHKAKKLDWTDLITRDGTKVSMTKILQMVGGVVATWIVIQMTMTGTLTWDIFAIYLSYVASVDGFSKLIMAKYGAEGSDDSRVPYRRSGYLGNNNHGNDDDLDKTIRKTTVTVSDTQEDTRPAGSAKTPGADD